MKVSSPFASISGAGWIQRSLRRWTERHVRGPSAEQREAARVQFWGRVEDGEGRSLEGWLETPEGYSHTVDASLAIVERVLAGDVPPGAWTPSRAFGPSFVTRLPGCRMEIPANSPTQGAEGAEKGTP